jgi:hypothetical protein
VDWGAITFKVTAGPVIPDKVAVMTVVPAAIPVAKPSPDIAATAVLELVHVTLAVMFCLIASKYVPMARYC